MKTLIFLLMASASLNAQNLINTAGNIINQATQGGSGSNLSNDEIVSGLREALNVGSKNAAGSASKRDGCLKNPAITIPFPSESKVGESKARQLGTGPQVD